MASRPLKDFISEIKNDGLARTSRFDVMFNIPSAVQSRSGFGNNLQKILLFCDQTQLPGLTYSTTQSRTFGEFRELPYEKLFDNITLSFYVDVDMNVKKLFDSWMASIQNQDTKTFSYYKSYTTNVIITVYDIKEQKRYSVTLFEAYPKNMSSITLDYSSKDIMKLQVGIMYKNWKSDEYVSSTNVTQFDQKAPFSINGKVPGDYFNNFSAFQGRFNDYNNVFQNNSIQYPEQNVVTETGAGVVDFT